VLQLVPNGPGYEPAWLRNSKPAYWFMASGGQAGSKLQIPNSNSYLGDHSYWNLVLGAWDL